MSPVIQTMTLSALTDHWTRRPRGVVRGEEWMVQKHMGRARG